MPLSKRVSPSKSGTIRAVARRIIAIINTNRTSLGRLLCSQGKMSLSGMPVPPTKERHQLFCFSKMKN